MSDTNTAAVHYVLPAEMTIPYAGEVREALLQAISVGQNEFEAHGIEAIDSAGIQLLLAMQGSLNANGTALKLIKPSIALLDALRLYGLGDVVQQEH